jgi:hypothetical protein
MPWDHVFDEANRARGPSHRSRARSPLGNGRTGVPVPCYQDCLVKARQEILQVSVRRCPLDNQSRLSAAEMMPLNATQLEMDERSPWLGSRRFDGDAAMVNGKPGGDNPSTRLLRCTW